MNPRQISCETTRRIQKLNLSSLIYSSTQEWWSVSEPCRWDTFYRVNWFYNTKTLGSGTRSRTPACSVDTLRFCSASGCVPPSSRTRDRLGPRGSCWRPPLRADWCFCMSAGSAGPCWRSLHCRSGRTERPGSSTAFGTASRTGRTTFGPPCRRHTVHTGWTGLSSPRSYCTLGTEM